MCSITVWVPPKTTLATWSVLLLVAAFSLRCAEPAAPAPSGAPVPPVILWAWERPENLSFLQNRPDVGVAFLAATLRLNGDRFQVRPRLQPLNVADGTFLVAVARIESDSDHPPAFNQRSVQHLAQAVLAATDRDGVSAIQVDFDATLSERPLYSELLKSLRRQVTAGKRLSITALASWCSGDPWIVDLPVDEAVPMLFQMGPDSFAIERRLATGRDFALPVCRRSVGLSLDETKIWSLVPDRRLYLFNATPWTEQTASKAIQRWWNRNQ